MPSVRFFNPETLSLDARFLWPLRVIKSKSTPVEGDVLKKDFLIVSRVRRCLF